MMSANAMWANTGYGTQTRSLLPRLKALGHECANFAWYGLQGGMMALDGIQVYPLGYSMWGDDIAGQYVKHFQAEVIITLMDLWVLRTDYRESIRPACWIAWAPVDHEPIPPKVAERWATADIPVSYSLRGLELAQEAGIENVVYIPHGLETGTFRPGDKREARDRLKLPQEAYICTMVAANKGMPARKAFSENLQAFRRFKDHHAEACLYMHTVQGTAHNGMDLGALLANLELTGTDVWWVDQLANHLGLPNQYMADVYRASDVLLAASMGEGFGLPIMEAQACGCPVITTRWSAMPELTVYGVCTEPAQKVWSPLLSWAAVPSVEGIYQALETIYGWNAAEHEERREAGILAMRERYDWDTCVRQYWLPLLERAGRMREAWLSPTSAT